MSLIWLTLLDYSKDELKERSWKYFISYNVAAFVIVVFAVAIVVAIVLSLLSVFSLSMVLKQSWA